VNNDLDIKLEDLKRILLGLESAVVAYSGGVDSTFLLKVALDTLGKDKVLAAIGISETYPSREATEAVEMAQELGARYRTIHTEELANPQFAANPPDRCFHCKSELFGRLLGVAREEGLRYVVDGSNYDDLRDFRPGMRAGALLGVRKPLQEAGLTKADIRELSRRMGLRTWNKPAAACLSSRFPYGTPITPDALTRVDRAEAFLRSLGIGQLRVRHHDNLARIEVEPVDLPLLIESANRARIVAYFKELGYTYITVDLAGYRPGSMNEVLTDASRVSTSTSG